MLEPPTQPDEACLVREDRAIRLLLRATASKTGEAFFRALVKSLAEALGTSAAWVTEFDPENKRLRSLAMWSSGSYVEGYSYDVAGTPCEPVINACALAHFADSLVELFPADPDLPPMKAVSYVGAPFTDADGRLLGHVAAIDTKPMPEQKALATVVELFATRAGAEYQREKAHAEARDREAQLERLLESALDAILILDADLTITKANPSALATFGSEQDDLLGESLIDFLEPSSAAHLAGLLKQLSGAPQNERRLWIPQGIEAIRWDRTVFLAESTLSQYEFGGVTRYTLILRNADEKQAARRRIQELSHEAEYVKSVLDQVNCEHTLLGACPAMEKLSEDIKQVAGTNATALLLGETGTGKELVARRIHHQSPRRNKPLVCVNCAAIPENLMESEFFGHEKGAFTSASEQRKGRFERANGGTLFLDEVGELPLSLQAKLLRVIQEGEFERLGGSEIIKVDVRIIAATHCDLEAMARDGRFRSDLFYRLNVFPLSIPPLRERGQDILLLAEAFIQRLRAKIGRNPDPLSEDDKRLLLQYDWPGNARELQNVIERAMIQSDGKSLRIRSAMPQRAQQGSVGFEADALPVYSDAQMRAFAKQNIERALEQASGAVFGTDGAAALLGIRPTTLLSRIKKLGIQRG